MTMSRALPYAAAAIVLAICIVGFSRPTHAAASAPLTGDLSVREAYWASLIKKEGPAQAYKDFGAAVAILAPPQQHENAHVFGGALYSAIGLPGLSTCDSNYSFGCFHEFLGRAIASLGLSVVNQLNQDCVTALGPNSLSCQHGIGHGIEAALGYDFPALQKSLSLCESLPHNDPIGGCYGGALMEYNMQTMLGEQGKPRPLTSAGVQYPCDSIDSAFQNACYFWQPQWWAQTLRRQGTTDLDEIYRTIGTYCAAAPAADQRSCYEGTGNNLPADANFDGDRARQLCIDVSSDPQDQLYCRALAADSLFVGGAGKKGDALAVCEGLTGSAYSFCASYASNSSNIAKELPSVK